eukprot:scaffold161396_cov30-Tisochrysis_lutea.AAC.4
MSGYVDRTTSDRVSPGVGHRHKPRCLDEPGAKQKERPGIEAHLWHVLREVQEHFCCTEDDSRVGMLQSLLEKIHDVKDFLLGLWLISGDLRGWSGGQERLGVRSERQRQGHKCATLAASCLDPPAPKPHTATTR